MRISDNSHAKVVVKDRSTAVLWKFNAYWNSVYRKIFFYEPWESVRDVMKCLGKKTPEFIYYERKLCFLHNMLLSNNDVITCMHYVCICTL